MTSANSGPFSASTMTRSPGLTATSPVNTRTVRPSTASATRTPTEFPPGFAEVPREQPVQLILRIVPECLFPRVDRGPENPRVVSQGGGFDAQPSELLREREGGRPFPHVREVWRADVRRDTAPQHEEIGREDVEHVRHREPDGLRGAGDGPERERVPGFARRAKLRALQPRAPLRHGLREAGLLPFGDLAPQPRRDPDLRGDALERPVGRTFLHATEVDAGLANLAGVAIVARVDLPAPDDRPPDAGADPDGDHRSRSAARAEARLAERGETDVVLEAEPGRRKRRAEDVEDLPVLHGEVGRPEEEALLRVDGSGGRERDRVDPPARHTRFPERELRGGDQGLADRGRTLQERRLELAAPDDPARAVDDAREDLRAAEIDPEGDFAERSRGHPDLRFRREG